MTAPEATDPTPCDECETTGRNCHVHADQTPGEVRLSDEEDAAVAEWWVSEGGDYEDLAIERLTETVERIVAERLAARDAEAEGPVIPNAGPWEHMDGTPCPYYVASRPRPDDENYWWCTEHQQHVRTSGAPESIRDRDALISYLEVRLARAEAAEAEVAELRKRAVSALIATGRHTVDTARAALGGEHA